MRFLLVIVILFITGYNVSGSSRFRTASLVERVKSNRELGGRTIRAATSCQDAYQETLSTRFELCENYLNDEYSNEELDKFCNENCGRTLGSVYRDIARFCGEDELLNFTTVFLPLFCLKNEFGDYCIQLLERIYVDNLPTYFNECLATTYDGRCTDACKNVAEYIETKLGCCYETFAQQPAIGLPREFIYQNDFFTHCYGEAIEPACPRYSSAVHPSRTTSHRPTRSTSSFRPTRSSSVRPTRTSGIRPTRTSGIRPTRTRGGIHHTRTRFNSGPTPN